jgi:protoheme IX farnesyltransferase
VLKAGTTSVLQAATREDEAIARRAERATKSLQLSERLDCYWKLAKGKLTVWVTLSALPGYLLAVPGAIDPCLMACLATGTMLTSGSAQAMNQIYEVDRDRRMGRTAGRPLPSGKMSIAEASAFALATSSTGLGILAVGCTPSAAVVAGATIVTYVGAYTPMKVVSPYNTHIGAISGSLPTLLGFYAALGVGLATSPWGAHALWLFSMQTLWQMPHFYALAWIYRSDYLKGGYNMFPLKDSTGLKTAAMSKPYLVAMCAMPWAASAMGLASWMLPIGAAVPSAIWWISLKKFEQNPSVSTCRRFFLGSLSYLLAVLVLFTAYARAEQPQLELKSADADSNEECQHASSASDSLTLEPAWRARFCAYFAEFCPHEEVQKYVFGTLSSSCPFSSPKGSA